MKPFSNNYAEQSEYYRRANVAQRIIMEDRFYWLTMKLLGKIIGPFEGSGTGKGLIQRAAWEHEEKRKSQPIRFGRRAINRRKEVSY